MSVLASVGVCRCACLWYRRLYMWLYILFIFNSMNKILKKSNLRYNYCNTTSNEICMCYDQIFSILGTSRYRNEHGITVIYEETYQQKLADFGDCVKGQLQAIKIMVTYSCPWTTWCSMCCVAVTTLSSKLGGHGSSLTCTRTTQRS